MKPFSRTLLPLACVALFGSAHAQTTPNVQTSPWSLAVGAVHLGFNTKADLYAGGPVPGAGVDASSDTIAGLEIAYSFNPNWTARLDLGTPVKTNLSGTGNLGALGRLGGVKGGPAILTLTYSPGMWGQSPILWRRHDLPQGIQHQQRCSAEPQGGRQLCAPSSSAPTGLWLTLQPHLHAAETLPQDHCQRHHGRPTGHGQRATGPAGKLPRPCASNSDSGPESDFCCAATLAARCSAATFGAKRQTCKVMR
nr:hypothetical protein (bphD 3' region) - Pseudomonas sp. (strain KKS102) [Pseudomonas sp.]